MFHSLEGVLIPRAQRKERGYQRATSWVVALLPRHCKGPVTLRNERRCGRWPTGLREREGCTQGNTPVVFVSVNPPVLMTGRKTL